MVAVRRVPEALGAGVLTQVRAADRMAAAGVAETPDSTEVPAGRRTPGPMVEPATAVGARWLAACRRARSSDRSS